MRNRGWYFFLVVTLVVATAPVVADGAPLAWHFEGTVTRLYNLDTRQTCIARDPLCPLADVIGLGSPLFVDLSFDTNVPEASNCRGFYPGAVQAVHTQVGGTAYIARAVYTWMGAYGFENGCATARSGAGLEIITLDYVYDGPVLPYPFGTVDLYGDLGGRWRSGMDGGWSLWPVSQQPRAMRYISPVFTFVRGSPGTSYFHGQFEADLVNVPAPSGSLLLALGVTWQLWRHRRRGDGLPVAQRP